MKRWLAGLLLVVLTGVLLLSVINSNRDPIAVPEEWGATIERNEKGEVVEVSLVGASISPPSQELLHLSEFGQVICPASRPLSPTVGSCPRLCPTSSADILSVHVFPNDRSHMVRINVLQAACTQACL
jgi:hypothetical protein